MIEREKLEEIFDARSRDLFQENADNTMKALNLLREKIPYDACGSIIGAAGHDVIYLCDIKDILLHIDEEDAKILVDCGVFIDTECSCLSLFI